MKVNPNDAAFPFALDEAHVTRFDFGLTVRAYFVAKAMQGFCANPESSNWNASQIARYSIEQADAAIAELNKEPSNG